MVTDFNVSWDGYSTPYIFRGSDGKIKLLSGSEHGQIYYYENIEGNLIGEFTQSDNLWREVDSVNFTIRNGFRTSAAVTNINADGYLDLFTGNFSGGLELYGTLAAPIIAMDIPEPLHAEVSEIRFYPNPARENVTIEYDGLEEIHEIMVYDITGRPVTTEMTHGELLGFNISGFPEGIYVVRLTDVNGNTATGRLLVRH
jgi:hypothetical protein